MPRDPESKLVPFSKLSELGASLRASAKRIVTTNGCFDLLHWGHLRYLAQARALGDCLICAVNADASVRGLKGPGRPLNDEWVRALSLAAIEAVDYVVIFPESTPDNFLERVRPAIHVKGGDYRPEALPERATVEKHGGRVQCLPLVEGLSTTALVEKIRHGIF